MTKDEIIIRSGIIHILDNEMGMPVLSQHLLELSPDLNDFIRGLIYKIQTGDELKKCSFHSAESSAFSLIQDFTEERMVEISSELAQQLYGIMAANVEIPSADFLVATYQVESQVHLALLKLNYKETFIHFSGNTTEGTNFNDIIKQTQVLPNGSQKLSEAVLINLNDYSVEIMEKKYPVNGEKINYLSELYLKCYTETSEKTKMNIVTRAVEQINQKYFEAEIGKKMEAKQAIQNQIEQLGEIQVEEFCEKIYGDIPEIKEELVEKLEKYHVADAVIVPKNEATTKKFQRQCLKTDTGIEILIPMDQYNENDSVEFITNPDGTTSIHIKNINHITTK